MCSGMKYTLIDYLPTIEIFEDETFIKSLQQRYDLSELECTRILSEFELTRVKIEFAIQKAMDKNIPFKESYDVYAGMSRFLQPLSSQQKERIYSFVDDFNCYEYSSKDLNTLIFETFKQLLSTRKICHKYPVPESCFSYTMYNKTGVNLHFENVVVPTNPLKGKELERRKQELKRIATELYNEHPEVEYIFGVSWIRSISSYKCLFPKETSENEYEYKEPDFYSQGHWGQFYNADGTLNKERIEEFKKTGSFPIPCMVSSCDITFFYRDYL